MKSRLSHSILLILVLSLALQTTTFPVLAKSESIENQAVFENMPPELADRYQRDSESVERLEYIPPSPEIVAKTQAQVDQFDCSTVTDVSQIECEALVALYESTNGAGWWDNTNWLESPTVSTWYGVTVNNGVTKLDLFFNKLTGTIPSALGDLSNLRFLDFSYNWDQLTGSIPAALGNLSNLREVYLDNNQLTGSIPAELGNMSNLQVLWLYNNQLTGHLPAELGNLSYLWHLFLDDNPLTGRIPLSFVNLTNLDFFYASGTELCEPKTPEFVAWKSTVTFWDGPGVICENQQTCLPLIFR